MQHKKSVDSMLIGGSSHSPIAEAPMSPKYSDRLSPAINQYLSEASHQEVRVYVPVLSFFFLAVK